MLITRKDFSTYESGAFDDSPVATDADYLVQCYCCGVGIESPAIIHDKKEGLPFCSLWCAIKIDLNN